VTPSTAAPATAVFFMSATASPDVLAEYARLAEGLPPGWSARLLFDEAASTPPADPIPGTLLRFDSRRFAEWGFATYGKTLVPGHTLFPLLRAARDEPALAHAWFVEHDVRFTGSWRLFFDAFSTVDADLLTTHVRRHAEEPYWELFPTLAHPTLSVPMERRLRSFNVVARFSRRAVEELCRSYEAGWSGHHEVLVPTLLAEAGLSIVDLGGDGSFVPAGFRNRFYTSCSTYDGCLRGIGTVRFRPARRRPGPRRNFLYHPVKVGPVAKAPVPEGRMDTARQVVRHAHWRLRRALGMKAP
jgi:hypothetical protein